MLSCKKMRAVIKSKYGGLENFCKVHNLPYHKCVRAFQKKGVGVYESLYKEIIHLVEIDLIEIEKLNKFRGTIRKEIEKKHKSLRNFAMVSGIKYYDLWKYLSGGYYYAPDKVGNAIANLNIISDGKIMGRIAVSSC